MITMGRGWVWSPVFHFISAVSITSSTRLSPYRTNHNLNMVLYLVHLCPFFVLAYKPCSSLSPLL